MNTLPDLQSNHSPREVPTADDFLSRFSGWSVWVDPDARTEPGRSLRKDSRLGVLLFETGINLRRFFLSGGVFGGLALISSGLALAVPEATTIFLVAGLVFLGIALYRLLAWFLNRGTRVRIYREGFQVQSAGKDLSYRWDQIREVREDWQKTIYQGIIHIHSHRVKVITAAGEKVVLDRTIQEIPRVGRLIQQAVAQHRLPEFADQLAADQILDFGPLQISRYGIKSRAGLRDKVLPWEQVRSLTVDNIGRTTLKIYPKTDRKFVLPWSSVPGKKIPNLHLLILLVRWFIKGKVPAQQVDVPPLEPGQDDDVRRIEPETHYLLISSKEAERGTVKSLVVGSSHQERELTLRIPPGTQTGRTFRFPGAGKPDAAGKGKNDLVVSVIIDESTPLKTKLREGLLILGILILILGMMWISLWSYLPLLISTGVAALIGGVSGVLMAYPNRWVGAVSGWMGGAVSFGLQVAYYRLMYLSLGRLNIWNYEAFLLMALSLIPGFLLYNFWTKRQADSPRSPSLSGK